MPDDDATRFQVELFGDGESIVLDAEGRAHSASVVVREPKDAADASDPDSARDEAAQGAS